MATFYFENEGLPGVRIKTVAKEEHIGREELEAAILEAGDWLELGTVHEWQVRHIEW